MKAKGERIQAKSRPTEQRLDTAILRDARDFAALEEEWDDLYCHSLLATPFQSWAWLYSWWEHYGGDYELLLITVRDGDLLVGLMPLMLRSRLGLGRLLLIGTGSTDYLDMLARDGWKQEVAEAGGRALKELDVWRVADLGDVRPKAAIWDLFHDWAGPKTHFYRFGSPVIDVRPWDEVLASLSRNHRSTVRRALRRAEEDGVRPELAAPDDVEEAVAHWVALHKEAWKGRNIAPEHLDERFVAHLKAAACRMAVRGLGGISEFWRDGEVIASQFLILGRDFVGQHLFGATQEALQRYQVSSLYVWDALNAARAQHSAYLDLLRGEEPYKLRWASRVLPNHRLVLGRDWFSWAPYADYQSLRSRAERYAYFEGAPGWVKKAVSMRLALRRRMRAKSIEGYQSG
jgi:CelD/BcsL family acetyltransferase involved in cellulose biosynthesis